MKSIGAAIPKSDRSQKYYLVAIGFHPISLIACFHVPAANADKYLHPNSNNKCREKRYCPVISEACFSKDQTFLAHPMCTTSVSLGCMVSWLSRLGRAPGELDYPHCHFWSLVLAPNAVILGFRKFSNHWTGSNAVC